MDVYDPVPDFRRERSRVEHRLPYTTEQEFYALVATGDTEALEGRDPHLLMPGQGVLSPDPLVNMKEHFVVSTALCTRACIAAGLSPDEAYTMSDGFIQQMNRLCDEDGIEALHRRMLFTFSRRMRAFHREGASSRHIRRAIDYINLHLETALYIDDIAAFVGLNGKYLCTLFKKETDVSITDYIERRKMESARNMLLYTDFSCQEISDTLCYSSPGYFSKLFKKRYGLSPTAFRAQKSR